MLIHSADCLAPNSYRLRLLVQITWRFYDVFLGIVMVYDAEDGTKGPDAGHVHCMLSWAPDALGPWQWVDATGLKGAYPFTFPFNDGISTSSVAAFTSTDGTFTSRETSHCLDGIFGLCGCRAAVSSCLVRSARIHPQRCIGQL